MTTTPEIVAFLWDGREPRSPSAGECASNMLGGVSEYAGGSSSARFIYTPIPATHPKAADILALVPRPKTLGERCAIAINEAECVRRPGFRISPAEVAAIIDRLAAEGKGG